MSRQYTLYTQQPKPKKIGIGVLSIAERGEAHFFSGKGEQGSEMLADMARARLDFAGSSGIKVSGFEQTGVERDGRPKYRFQEWWLVYLEK